MKKKLIILVALVVALGAAIAALMLLDSQPAEVDPALPASSATETIYVIGGIPNPFVTEVKIQNELDSFTVINNHENAIAMQNAAAPDFTIDGLEQEFLAQATLKSVATNCAALDAKQTVEGGDLAAYGLDAPRATVEAFYDDGATAAFEIGDDAPGGVGTYVAKDGKVYLVASAKLTNMLLSRYGFANKSVTGGSSGADGQTQPTVFTKIVIGGAKFPEPVVLDEPPETNEELASMGVSSFLMTAPLEAEADMNALTPLSSVFGLSATEAVALAADPDALTTHGLAEPVLTTEVVTEDPEVGSFTLHFSEADAEGNLFVRRLDRPFIYKLPVASVPWYEFDLFDYMQKLAVLPFIDTVSEIDVIADGDMVYTFVLEGEGDELVVTANDQPIETDYFKKFYQTLISASYEAETGDDAPDPAATPVLQYVYRYRDGSEPDVVTFLPGPARRYFIRLNDGAPFFTKSLYVDTALADLQTLLAGEEVDSYI